MAMVLSVSPEWQESRHPADKTSALSAESSLLLCPHLTNIRAALCLFGAIAALLATWQSQLVQVAVNSGLADKIGISL